jgi:hypothetical protein
VDSATRGDPMSPLLWISRSLEHVTEALRGIGYALSTFVVRWTLKSLGYRLQANRKTHEGGKHPDRNAQFLYIKAQKEKFVAAGRPILSIDAKKKGADWQLQERRPRVVREKLAGTRQRL